MVDIGMIIDVRKALAGYDLSHKQVRFSAAKALNDLTWLAAQQAQNTLPDKFVLRKNWFQRGFRGAGTSGAAKASKARLIAEVLHKDPQMGLQEEGGQKPRRSRVLAVPGKLLRPMGPAKDPKKIAKRDWPMALEMPGRRGFFTRFRSGAFGMAVREPGTEAGTPRRAQGRLARALFGRRYDRSRVRPRGRRLKRKIRVAYVMTRRARINKRLNLVGTTTQVVNRTFRALFIRYYAEALRTAKA